ncbi:MAG: tyrosine-type recombinase/integrase [Planctomycetaceae bacterium]|nr:tyrosine-type recombinase/integrase [Planctomycetaceae bacterium]
MSKEYTAGAPVRQASDRPEKPWPEFPLFPSPLGYWSKKIRGKAYNFGRWGRIKNGVMTLEPYVEGYTAAKLNYEQRLPDILAGKVSTQLVTPKEPDDDGLTLKVLCDKFLNYKLAEVNSKELSQRTFQELHQTAQKVCDVIGKHRQVDSLGPDDFAKLHAAFKQRVDPTKQKPMSVHRIGNAIVRTKAIFNHGIGTYIVNGPVKYGTAFKKPSVVKLREAKNNSDKKLFTAEEIRSLIEAADVSLRAMIYLGINAGLGNTDVTCLQFSNLKSGWLDYPRQKTQIGRRCPLWPETIAALDAAIAQRPKPADPQADADTVLLTSKGERFIRVHTATRTDLVTTNFGRLLTRLDIVKGRKGIGFYSLRHTFATIGLETGDRDAVKSLMGHAYGDILATYDETGPSDARLRAVVDHVRSAILGAEGGAV